MGYVGFMRTGFCRYCHRDIHNDNHYYGYCSIACCLEFASKKSISFAEAKDVDLGQQERRDLEDKIDELNCYYQNASGEAEETYRDLDKAEYKIINLEAEVNELENLDWKKIKKEREREDVYNESVLRKVNNIKHENDNIKEKMKKVMKDNILLKDQNLDLLNSIKEMKGHSERFQQLDLGIELDYDE